jgi:death on curing protein
VTLYLTPEQVLFLHSRLIQETGGSHGVLDLSMLLSALGRPQASFEGIELYTDVFAKAAALMDSLIRNHPFVDGNKRTAIAAAGIFLRHNGYQLTVENSEMVTFTLDCARSNIPLEQIADWLKRYCSRVELDG